ncbi:MAG TPA: ABC transporter substrate-binding protein, partial [Limnochordia bacterium]
ERAYQALAARATIGVAPYGSQLTAAALAVARRFGLPLVVHAAGDPDLDLMAADGRAPLAASVLPPNDRALSGAVAWGAAQGARRIALLFRSDPFSRAVAAGARRRALELGLQILWDRTFERSAAIWEVAYGAAGAFDLLLGGGYVPGGGASGFLPDAQEIALAFRDRQALLALLVAPAFPEFRDAVGSAADGVVGNTHWQPWFPWPGNRRFVRAYRERWGAEPDAHAAAAFAAGQLIEAAWQAAGLPPRSPLAEVRARIAAAFSTLDAMSVVGPLKADGSGHLRAQDNPLVQWRGERLVWIWPPSARSVGSGPAETASRAG